MPPGPTQWKAWPAFFLDRASFVRGIAEYGGIVSLPLGPLKGYLVTHPDLVQEVLQERHRFFPKGSGKDALSTFLGDGVTIATGDTWLQQRRLIQPAFHRSAIERMITTIVDVVETTLATIPLDGRIEIRAMLRYLTMEVAARVLFGSTVRGDATQIDQAVSTALRYLSLRTMIPSRWPTPGYRRFLQASADLDQIIYGLISARRTTPPTQPDVLDLLIHSYDEETGAQLSDQQIRDQLISIFLAGFETTGMLLTWALPTLVQHGQIHDAVYHEIDTVCGTQQPTSSSLMQLTYTRMVIDETLRLYPPIWMFWRVTAQDGTLGGYPVQTRQRIYVSPFVTQRLEAFWPDPDVFRPERFQPGAAPQRPRFAYFPFGGGPRQCVGNVLAPFEAQIIIAMLAQRAVFKLDGPPPQVALNLTLQPQRPIWMHAIPRTA
jgi:cytochrome P450